MFTSISPFSRSCLFVLLTSALLTACNSSETTSSLNQGDVALLITDAPTSAYHKIMVEAEQVSLVGEGLGNEAHLLDRPARFNLLDLRNSFRRLSRCKAPVGTYNRVRFRIKDIELLKDGENEGEGVHPHLKRQSIDLVALKQFAVSRHHRLVVKLDLDADKSLDADQDGQVDTDQNGDPVFDPDATVDTDEVPTDTDVPPQEATPVLMNQLGDVVLNPQTPDSFQLCNTATDGTVECVQVNVSPDTVVMNDMLAHVTGIGDLNETFQWRVFGHLDVATDTINALQVIQRSSQHRSYSGPLSGDYDAVNNQISLDVSGTVYPVSLDNLPGIYDSAGNVQDTSALVNGVNVEVIGILNTFPPPGTLKPGVIIISGP